jgi:carbamoyl-phosphate synthase large subunit
MTLEDLGVKDFDFQKVKHISVKEAVFPFSKFPRVPIFLGPEMRSTGEVMGIAAEFGTAFSKAQMGAGNTLPTSGKIFISVNDSDKNNITLGIVKAYEGLGFSFVATEGTCRFLRGHGIVCESVFKVNEGRPNIVDLIKNGEIKLVINTPLGEESRYDEYSIGWAAIEQKVSFTTTLSAAASAVKGIEQQKRHGIEVRSLQEYQKEI